MYKIYADGVLLASSEMDSLAVISPSYSAEMNKAATLRFTVPAKHRMADALVPMKTRIKCNVNYGVWLIPGRRSWMTLFTGMVTGISKDFFGNVTVECADHMYWLNDVIIRPQLFSGANAPYRLITLYNSLADPNRQFTHYNMGAADRASINYASDYASAFQVLDTFRQQANGYNYMVYPNLSSEILMLCGTKDPGSIGNRKASVGMNVTDLTQIINADSLCTRLIPLGATLGTETVPGVQDRVTISSVNGGLDYIDSASASDYGIIEKTVIYDDITDPAVLLERGRQYLSEVQYANLVIQANATNINSDFPEYAGFCTLGESIQVVSRFHGINAVYMLTQVNAMLDDANGFNYVLGDSKAMPISERTASLERGGA